MTRASEISEAAAQWLMRLEAQTSPEMWDAFQGWLDTDARHRAAFIRLRAAWNRIDVLKTLRPLDGTIDADLLKRSRVTAASVASLGPHPLAGKLRRKVDDAAVLPDRRRTRAIAAGIAAGVVAAGVFGWLGMQHVSWKHYETSIGGREEVTIEDGSVIDLNTDTALQTRITVSRRDIELTRGEALFHVAHDSKRPFFVRAGGTLVRAVGTEFSVRIRDAEHVDVLVAEGRVAVGAPGAASSLASPVVLDSAPRVIAGETASVGRNSVTVRSLPSKDVTRKLAWTGGHLAFQGETLAEAVSEFNRYNQRQLTIGDPSIVAVQVGGIFRVTDPDSFVAALQRSFGIHAQTLKDAEDIRLIADGNPPQ